MWFVPLWKSKLASYKAAQGSKPFRKLLLGKCGNCLYLLMHKSICTNGSHALCYRRNPSKQEEERTWLLDDGCWAEMKVGGAELLHFVSCIPSWLVDFLVTTAGGVQQQLPLKVSYLPFRNVRYRLGRGKLMTVHRQGGRAGRWRGGQPMAMAQDPASEFRADLLPCKAVDYPKSPSRKERIGQKRHRCLLHGEQNWGPYELTGILSLTSAREGSDL